MAADATSPLAILNSGGNLQDKPKQLKDAFDKWVTIQPPWVEALSTGCFGAFQGAFLGTLMGSMAKNTLEQGAGAGIVGLYASGIGNRKSMVYLFFFIFSHL